MKLTTEQVDYLFIFTRQHFVEWFDLQSELVDHLANAIEAEWAENPKISFDQALNKEFKKFGVFGFMDVVEQKRKQLSKKYYSIMWRHFKEFFGVPKLAVTALSIFVVYSFMQQIQDPKIYLMAFYTVFLAVVFYNLFKNRKQQKKESKKWLLKDIIFNFGSTNAVLVLLFQILNSSFFDIEQYLGKTAFSFFLSLFLVSIIVFGYIILYLIPSKADEYLSKTYPEYYLEKM